MIEEQKTIKLAGIVRESIVDGPGFRFAVFCQGCPHACQDCHNVTTHDFSGGKEVQIGTILKEIDKNPLLAGVTFTGGEPFCQPEAFVSLAKGVKERKLNIVTFTGYTYEELQRMALERAAVGELLNYTDLLIDGPFKKDEKDLTLQFRGSKNQRIIDMETTRKEGRPVLAEEYN